MLNLNKYLLIICLVLLTVCFFSMRTCNSERSSRLTSESNEAALHDSIAYHKDFEGQLHATIRAQQGSYGDLATSTQRDLDSAAKRLQISKRDIEGWQKIATQVKGQITARVDTIHDTASFTYEDNSIKETGTIVHDTIRANYTVDVPLILTEFAERKNWFAPIVHEVDATSTNKNAKVYQLQSALIIKEKPRVGRVLEGVGVGILIGLVAHSFIH